MKRYLQKGVTVVELMVGLTLSLLLIGGVLQVYFGTKSTYEVGEGLSRLQESTRFSMEMLARDIRMAGYVPCNQPQGSQNLLNSTEWWAQAPFANPVLGFEGDAGTSTFPSDINSEVIPGSDAIIILRGGNQVAGVNFYDAASDQITLQRDQAAGWVDSGSAMLVCNQTFASIFKAGTVQTDNVVVDSETDLQRAYGNDALIANYTAVLYHIRESSSEEGNSLYRNYLITKENGEFDTRAEELIEGVESMQLLYGVDDDGDAVANKYIKADAITAANDWANVVSVRIGMLFASQDGLRSSGETDDDIYIVAGTGIGISGTGPTHSQDRKKRYVSSMTVSVRNI